MDVDLHKKELEELASIAKRMNELSNGIMNRVDERMNELDAKAERWKKMEEQMEENAKKLKNKVILDVGGKRFITSKSTLLMHNDTYFSALLTSGKFEPEEDGSYFIDRNPKYFAIILEYLRTNKLSIKHLNSEQISALQDELDYFQIPTPPTMSFHASKIITLEQVTQIEKWTGKTFGDLLWRGSEHGFGVSRFHSLCDHKGPTVTLIKEASKGWIFGGYNSDPWNSGGNYYGSGSDHFLFTLTNPHNILPTKYVFGGSYRVYGNAGYGPTWGGGHDITIQDQPNTNSNSYTGFPHCYRDTTGKGAATFTGSRNFMTSEVEVFEMK